MFKKIKDILGIEGVKLEIILEERYELKSKVVSGKIILSSQSEQFVERLQICLYEKYKRGRGEETLINEYLLGSLDLQLDLDLVSGQTKELEFDLVFEEMKSDIDKLEEANIFSRPFIWIAKKIKRVDSSYRLEATAFIRGTKLHPIFKSEILFS